jgi:hypothetical protein
MFWPEYLIRLSRSKLRLNTAGLRSLDLLGLSSMGSTLGWYYRRFPPCTTSNQIRDSLRFTGPEVFQEHKISCPEAAGKDQLFAIA